MSPTLAAVQKVRLLLAQRGGEVVAMRWQDVDVEAGWWTIPAEQSKNGEPHRVPLTAEAIEIISAQPKEDGATHVFTGRGGGLVEDRVRKAGAALSRVLGFEFRSHDLRRTAATRMAAAGVPREHIAHVLNHVQGGPRATRVYDRYHYDTENGARSRFGLASSLAFSRLSQGDRQRLFRCDGRVLRGQSVTKQSIGALVTALVLNYNRYRCRTNGLGRTWQRCGCLRAGLRPCHPR